MDDLTEEAGPLNPYARIFFSLWGLTVFVIVCFRLAGPAEENQTTERQPIESRVSNPGWLSQKTMLNKLIP